MAGLSACEMTYKALATAPNALVAALTAQAFLPHEATTSSVAPPLAWLAKPDSLLKILSPPRGRALGSGVTSPSPIASGS